MRGGGEASIIIAFIIALGINAFAYWNFDKMVLLMYSAHEVDEQSAPSYHHLVVQLADRADIPIPRSIS